MSNSIPYNWLSVNLAEIADPKDKFSFRGGPFGSDLKSNDYTSSGVRIVQLQDIGEGRFLNKSNVRTSKEKADSLAACIVFPGDILLAKMAPVARCCFVPSLESRYLMCSDGIRFAVDESRFDKYYIFQALNGPEFRKTAESKSTGSTRGRIGLSELKAIHLPIPPFPEQQKIAAILTAMDDKLDVVARQIAVTKTLKQGLMQTLFTKGVGTQDATGRWVTHVLFKKCKTANYPDSWEMVSFESVAPIIRRPVEIEPDALYPELGLRSFGKGTFHKPALPGTEVGNKRLFKIQPGDLLFSNVFAWEGSVAVAKKEDDGRFGSHRYITCKVDNEIANTSFVFRYITTPDGIELLKLASPGGAGRNRTLGLSALAAISIPLPPLDEQDKITEILDGVDSKLSALINKQSHYQTLKRGLMQKLLTGEWRVKLDVESAVHGD